MTYDTYHDTVRTAAAHVAPALRRLGFEAEDCAQEGWLALLRVIQADPERQISQNLAYTIARRGALKAARKKRTGLTGDPTYLERVEARGDFTLTAEFRDLIDAAPEHSVRVYLGLRVLDGMTWDETRAAMSLSNDALARVRTQAASWLLEQYEGGVQ